MLLTSGVSTGSLTGSVSYQPQGSASVLRSNIAATGSISLTIAGINFGIVGISLGTGVGVTTSELTMWKSDTSVSCRSPGGRKSSRGVVVTAGVTDGTFTSVFSFDAPTMSGVGPPNIMWSQYAGISLLGINFGQAASTFRASIGSTAIVGMQLWKDDTTVWCMVTKGVGHTKPIALTVEGQVGTGTELVSYNAPTVTSVCSGFAPDFSKPIVFTVRGQGMGYTSYSSRMRLGNTACAANDWVSDTTMQCRPVLTGFSAGATGLALIVTAGQTVSSLLSVFTYSAGKVTDVTYFNAPTIGDRKSVV